MINSHPCLLVPSSIVHLDKTSKALPEPISFGLNWPILLQPRNPQALHSQNLIKTCAPSPLSFSLSCSALCSPGAFPGMPATSSGPAINFSILISLVVYCWTTVHHLDIYISLFTVALFTVTKTWKPLKCPLMDDWIRKCSTYIYTLWNTTPW